MDRRDILGAGLIVAAGAVLPAAGQDGLRSGPQAGQRPLPFTSNLVTGPYRGKQHCYVCELKDEPAVLIFARRLDEPTARLLRNLRDAVQEHKSEKLFGWFVFLSAADARSEAELEQQLEQFARDNGASRLPVSALGDPEGPPGYRIAREADVTVLLFRSGKVLANRAYRAREWNNGAAGRALRDLDSVFGWTK